MVLQIKEPNDNFILLFIIGFIIICILSSLDSHAKPKPKDSFPIIIQSPPNKMLLNEGEYIQLLKLKKQLLA